MASKVVPKFALTATIALLMAGLWLVLHPEQGYACSPPPGYPWSVSEELERSEMVFLGQVVSVHQFFQYEGVWSSGDPKK